MLSDRCLCQTQCSPTSMCARLDQRLQASAASRTTRRPAITIVQQQRDKLLVSSSARPADSQFSCTKGCCSHQCKAVDPFAEARLTSAPATIDEQRPTRKLKPC